jgi:hypothetical protein
MTFLCLNGVVIAVSPCMPFGDGVLFSMASGEQHGWSGGSKTRHAAGEAISGVLKAAVVVATASF